MLVMDGSPDVFESMQILLVHIKINILNGNHTRLTTVIYEILQKYLQIKNLKNAKGAEGSVTKNLLYPIISLERILKNYFEKLFPR